MYARILLMVALASGCATLPWSARPRPAQPLPPALADYYAAPATALTARAEPLSPEPSSRWVAQRVTLEAPDQPPIRLDWYAPQGRRGRCAAVLIFPILWGNDLGVRDFARGFARQGIHGIIVYRPKDKFSMEQPLDQIEGHLRTSVMQARRVVDWLATQPSVDMARLGSLGISLGGGLNVLVAAVEPRLTRYVFVLPAARLAHVTMTTKDRSVGKKREEYLRRHGLTREAAERTLTAALQSEPLRVAGAIDPRRSLAVIALADRVIGRPASLDLWRALGRPPTIWLPTGHYTALAALPYVELKVLWFFQDWATPRAGSWPSAERRPAERRWRGGVPPTASRRASGHGVERSETSEPERRASDSSLGNLRASGGGHPRAIAARGVTPRGRTTP